MEGVASLIFYMLHVINADSPPQKKEKSEVAESNAVKNLEEAHASVGACRVFVLVCKELPYFRWLRRYEDSLAGDTSDCFTSERDLEQEARLQNQDQESGRLK
jgi:hypothetical protein